MPQLIAWDFDGVLNRNVVDGRFIWADRMEEDWGLDRHSFQSHVFGDGRGYDVMTGRVDLHDIIAEWLAAHESGHRADAFIDYWFKRDTYPDAEVIDWLHAAPARSVMATNNERHRARFITEDMGFGQIMEHIFASGHLGCAKPDDAYFEAIEAWSGLPPEDILLVDDLEQNVAGARARGWQAFHFTKASRDALPAALGLNGRV